MMFLNDLAKGLGMEKGNLSKLLKKLGITGVKVKVKDKSKRGQWCKIFDNAEIEKILEYRTGIPHNLIKIRGNYLIKTPGG